MQNALTIGNVSGKRENEKSGVELGRFLGTKWFKSLIPSHLGVEHFLPIACYKGKVKINGFEATVLVDMCDIILDARKNGIVRFSESQHRIAAQCEILVRSFAKVGIIALVDEATGYQYDRERDELQKILKAYISEELLAWQKRFPDIFYREIFRLNKWGHFMTGNIDIKKRPGVIGTWTNKLIYQQLPKGVLSELKRKTPKDGKGRRKHRFHQLLIFPLR